MKCKECVGTPKPAIRKVKCKAVGIKKYTPVCHDCLHELHNTGQTVSEKNV